MSATNESTASFEDCLRYLESVASRYPWGIPEEVIPAKADVAAVPEEPSGLRYGAGGESADLLFVAAEEVASEREPWPLSKASRGLVDAAVQKGMKRSGDSVYIMNLLSPMKSGKLSKETELDVEAFEREVKQVAPRAILVLGEKPFSMMAGKCLSCNKSFLDSRGEWFSSSSSMVLVSHAPAEVLTSVDVKREFWNDLQELMTRLAK
jgi:uracil-DNA glycosylase family 4